MDFFELVQARHSIRSYSSRPVEQEHLIAILEATSAAPSAGNLQAYEIIVIQEPQTRQALAEAALGQTFVAGAPLVLAFLQHSTLSAKSYGKRGADLYAVQDATIACTYAQLAATSLGLGSCWVGAFNSERVREVLRAPSELVPIALLPIGYADEQPAATPRRKLDSLVHFEHLGRSKRT